MTKIHLKYLAIILTGPFMTGTIYRISNTQGADIYLLGFMAMFLIVPTITSLISFNKYQDFKKGFKMSVLFSWGIYLSLIVTGCVTNPELRIWAAIIIAFGIFATFPSVLSVSYGIGKLFQLSKK